MRRRRLPSAAERLEHVQTLELLGRLVVATRCAVAKHRAFIVLSAS